MFYQVTMYFMVLLVNQFFKNTWKMTALLQSVRVLFQETFPSGIGFCV